MVLAPRSKEMETTLKEQTLPGTLKQYPLKNVTATFRID
jgi:hypothetical protein